MSLAMRTKDKAEIKQASTISLLSLLNLTFLPIIAFVLLLMRLKQVKSGSLAEHHLHYAIKLNIIAGVALIIVSLLMIIFGGFTSGWTWVFVITYFVLVHTIFIVIAVWALIRSWAGNRVTQ